MLVPLRHEGDGHDMPCVSPSLLPRRVFPPHPSGPFVAAIAHMNPVQRETITLQQCDSRCLLNECTREAPIETLST